MNNKVKELVEITAEIVAMAVNDASVMEGKGAEHYAKVILSHPDLALMTNITGKHKYGKYLSQVTVIPLAEALKEDNGS